MKLFYSGTSPYSRKVRLVIHEKGLMPCKVPCPNKGTIITETCLDIEQKSSTPGVDKNTENNHVFYVPARV